MGNRYNLEKIVDSSISSILLELWEELQDENDPQKKWGLFTLVRFVISITILEVVNLEKEIVRCLDFLQNKEFKEAQSNGKIKQI